MSKVYNFDNLPAGAYALIGSGGSGKTVVTNALVAAGHGRVLHIGEPDILVEANFTVGHYMTYTAEVENRAVLNISECTRESPEYPSLGTSYRQLAEIIQDFCIDSDGMGYTVIDSMSSVLYLESGFATMKGGVSSSIYALLAQLSNVALKHDLRVITVINPLALGENFSPSALEGMASGIITATKAGWTVNGRTLQERGVEYTFDANIASNGVPTGVSCSTTQGVSPRRHSTASINADMDLFDFDME